MLLRNPPTAKAVVASVVLWCVVLSFRMLSPESSTEHSRQNSIARERHRQRRYDEAAVSPPVRQGAQTSMTCLLFVLLDSTVVYNMNLYLVSKFH